MLAFYIHLLRCIKNAFKNHFQTNLFMDQASEREERGEEEEDKEE